MIAADLNRRLAEACAGTYAGAAPQWQDPMQTVHVFLSLIDGVHCIAWEGTTDLQEWLIDFLAFRVPFTGAYGATHFGLTRDVMSVVDPICAYLDGLGWPPYLNTGHSKGAGESIIFHAEMKRRGHAPLATRAFEPPQVGGAVLRDYLAGEDIAWTATVNAHGRDLVTQVPFGPDWCHECDPLLLTVPDCYDAATKHRIPAVLAALGAP